MNNKAHALLTKMHEVERLIKVHAEFLEWLVDKDVVPMFEVAETQKRLELWKNYHAYLKREFKLALLT